MRIGIPTEIKPDESRVAITPAGVAAFRDFRGLVGARISHEGWSGVDCRTPSWLRPVSGRPWVGGVRATGEPAR